MILYLFSTHFASGAPLEKTLSQDPDNLAQTPDGPLASSRYYGAPVYNWSVARTDNTITKKRKQALRAVVDAVCQLAPAERARIQGVTLLGELHQMVPDFEAGMGYEGAYRISDYSQASVQGFQSFLRAEFGTLAQLNRAMGTNFAGFDEVQPPSRDIRTQALAHYTEHIDAFAHGTLPIAGWAYLPKAHGASAPWIHIFLDGLSVGRVRAERSRQDVLKALPELESADTGWQMDLDFRRMEPGLHRIDVLLEQRPGELTSIGSREIAVMDRRQQTPVLQPQHALPATKPAVAGLRAYVDQPAEKMDYYFNPLVPWWHAFRNQQVSSYLQIFASLVEQSCLSKVPRFTHQILPFNASGRDPNKLAVDTSLLMSPRIYPGVSLYGDNAYGTTFSRWRSAYGVRTYGVVEFHPMMAMAPQGLEQVLQAHAAGGAQFLSFFLEPRWEGKLVERDAHNPFSFDPDNVEFGSDTLYRSMQTISRKVRE